MPNHVTTTLRVTGDDGLIDQFVSTHIVTMPETAETYGDRTHVSPAYRTLNFETVLPPPSEIEGIPSSSTTEDAVYALTGKMVIELMAEKLAENHREDAFVQMQLAMHRQLGAGRYTAERLARLTEDDLAIGRRAIAAIAACGYATWFDWNRANWGTKWNAYEYEDVQRSQGVFVCRFQTAWTVPEPILQALAARYPTLAFETHSFDEMWNFALHGQSHDGRFTTLSVPEDNASMLAAYERAYGVPYDGELEDDEDEYSDDDDQEDGSAGPLVS